MKKKIAMAAMALAVSAMAGSAFAADEPAKSTKTIAAMELVDANAVPAKLIQIVQQGGTTPFPDLKQLANEKGISVEELKAQLRARFKAPLDPAGNLSQAIKVTPAIPFQK